MIFYSGYLLASLVPKQKSFKNKVMNKYTPLMRQVLPDNALLH